MLEQWKPLLDTLRNRVRHGRIALDAIRSSGVVGEIRPLALAQFAYASVGAAKGPSVVVRFHAFNTPDKLALVDHDPNGEGDGDLRYTVFPELTAVCQDAAALGREAFASLHEMLGRSERGGEPVRKSLRTWLEIHASTAPVAAG